MEQAGIKTDPTTFARIMARVIQVARIAEAIALKLSPKLRRVLVIAALSGVWLAYYFRQLFTLSELVSGLLLLALLVPALLLARAYSAIQAPIGLPRQLHTMSARFEDEEAEVPPGSVAPDIPVTGLSPRLSDLKELGKSLREVKAMGGEAAEVASAAGGILVIANPAFVIMTTLLVVTAYVLLALAVVTGLFYLF